MTQKDERRGQSSDPFIASTPKDCAMLQWSYATSNLKEGNRCKLFAQCGRICKTKTGKIGQKRNAKENEGSHRSFLLPTCIMTVLSHPQANPLRSRCRTRPLR